MGPREHERVPYTVRVQYRNASSFLVAYSVNLSRGGMFLETDQPIEMGTEITIQFLVPDAGPISVNGHVAWLRPEADAEEPAGVGVEFHEMSDRLGELIDHLVTQFRGVTVLLVCDDRQDRSSLKRMIASIIRAANVVIVSDRDISEEMLGGAVDLAVLDADRDPASAIKAIRATQRTSPRIPTVVLASSKNVREKARAAGADEVTGNPPAFAEFRKLLVRALGRPAAVSSE